MRNLIKKVWEKVKWPLFLILWTAGIIGWGYFILTFPPMLKQADWAYSEAVKLHNQKVETKSVGDSSVKAESYAVSEDREELTTASLLPSGEIKEILPKIQMLESSGGKNDSCKNKNLGVNGYGFRQNTFEWKCYKTKEEVEKEVAAWFEKNLRDKTLAESLCYYNRGIVTENCEYAKKFAIL